MAQTCNGTLDNMTDVTEKRYTKVVIIGAGIAGIAAANHLCNNEFTDFLILEATNRIGGRIWSIDLETVSTHKVELGANWIHGIDLNPIYKIARDNNLLSNQYHGRALGKKMMFLTSNGNPVNTRLIQDVDLHYGMLMSECEDFYRQQIPTPFENDSVGAFIEREFDAKMEGYHGQDRKLRWQILQQRLLGECVISGADSMYDIALSEWGCFEDLPGVHFVIPPGFESVIQILQKNVPTQNVLFDHNVTRIKWERADADSASDENANLICVECGNGTKVYAELCLVTISLGYLKQYVNRLFEPALPDFKLGAIKNIAMGTVNKVILEFDGQILPDEIFRLEMVWDRDNMEEEDMSTRWVKKIGSFEAVADNVLMGWLSGKEAEYMETLTDEEVGEKCYKALKCFLSKTVKMLPNLKKVTRSAWKSHPYSLGAYCHIPVGTVTDEVQSMADPVLDNSDKTVLLFAGEATHPKFYSSAHGSLLSGQREAERILQLLTS